MSSIRSRQAATVVFSLCLLAVSRTVFPGSITGAVTKDSDGSPISSLWLFAYDYNTGAWQGYGQTDAAGVYEITAMPTGTYRVRVYTSGTEYRPEYYDDVCDEDFATPVDVNAGEQTSGIDFGLAVGGSISGRAADVNGLALEGVDITLYQGEDPFIADERAWDWVDSTSTDANGRYELTGLCERRYHLRVDPQQVSGTHYVEADLYNVQVFLGAETPDMNVTLRQAALIYGYVTTVDGNAIPSAEVVADASWREDAWDWHAAWTDSNGMYELWVAPSPGKFYPVWVDRASLGENYYESRWDANFYKAAYAGTRVDYTLELAGAVTGRVVNEDGVGIEGVWVEHDWGKYGNFGAWTETDSDGYFNLGSLPTGINYISVDTWWPVEQGGVKYAVGEAYAGPIDIAAGDVCDVGAFTIYEAGMVTGVVTDEAGFPVLGAEVYLEGQDIDGNPADSDEGFTDSFGQFTLDYVAPGTYVLSSERHGFITTIVTDITVNRGQHVDRDMVLKSSAEGAAMSGMIANYDDLALYDSENAVYYPYYDDTAYAEWGLPEFELIAVRADVSPTERDFLEPDRIIVGSLDDDEIDDGYGDYFEQDPCETPGRYQMALPSGDIAVGLNVVRDFLPGWGGCVIFHDWQRFDFAKGDVRHDVNFTAVTGDTGTLKGDISVPPDYNHFPEDWCLIFAYALDANNNPKTGIPLGDAAAFPGWTTQYEFRDLPVGKYQLKAYARNLASVLDLAPVTVVADANTILNISFTSGSTLTGHITDANSGADVNTALVTIEETGKQATTDDSGNYTIKGINAGLYTVSVSASGYADAQVADVNIEPNSTKVLDFALDSTIGSISGTVRTADGNNINGVTVLAYNETDGTYDTTETVGGTFTITDLTPGEYILAVDTDDLGYGVVTYPPDPNRITLAPDSQVNDVNIIVGTLQPPLFTVYSSAGSDVPPVLSMEFHSNLPLNAEPNIIVIDGNGALHDFTSNPAINRFTIVYDACESDNLVRINIAETDPLVPGDAAGKTFSFEVGSNLVQTSSTNVTNATGGEAAIMGTQDNTKIYVPPFAIAGANDTQALTLTIERYGDPGDAVEGSNDTTASAVYDFKFDEEGVSIDVDHTFTVTMSFQLPQGMSQQEFEATLEIRYFDAGEHQWKTDGISNVRINWANNTIMFEISHLTKFAAFVEVIGPCMTTVPDVLNLTEAAAETALNDANLVKGAITYEYSDTVDAGLVMEQEPTSGTSAPCDSAVNLVISTGPCMTTVPDVLNITEAVAETALNDANLVKGAVTYEYSDTVDAGLVMEQDPTSGTSVHCDSAVNLVISTGPCMATVPDVLGMTEAAAETALNADDLVKGAVTYECSDTVDAGLVMEQHPASGASVPCNSAVNLVISTGPCTASVPDVLGMTEAVAETTLIANDLVKGNVTFEYSDTVAASLVIAQDPASGATLPIGSAVNIVVSLGPPEVIAIKKCLVKAEDSGGPDMVLILGRMEAAAADLADADTIRVTVYSPDVVTPYVVSFPIDDKAFNGDTYNYARTDNASETSFKFDTTSGEFSFVAKNIDLTGLACPLSIEIEIGDYFGVGQGG
ncbi:MAG TPA: carboxypeptidase regulatory-like domain-containing protein [Sedimentisphaerales bacterium]|nr:carboxypeptidase regulatory-like domain-containing protein [Sedimentisphaerales bacterium]